MKCDTSNYQINFNRLVSKAKYSGKPSLSKHQIELLKAAKKVIAEIDKDLFETESLINSGVADVGYLNYLQNRLDVLNGLRVEELGIVF